MSNCTCDSCQHRTRQDGGELAVAASIIRALITATGADDQADAVANAQEWMRQWEAGDLEV